eukprot:2680273-Amphidinium_carterae.4
MGRAEVDDVTIRSDLARCAQAFLLLCRSLMSGGMSMTDLTLDGSSVPGSRQELVKFLACLMGLHADTCSSHTVHP